MGTNIADGTTLDAEICMFTPALKYANDLPNVCVCRSNAAIVSNGLCGVELFHYFVLTPLIRTLFIFELVKHIFAVRSSYSSHKYSSHILW